MKKSIGLAFDREPLFYGSIEGVPASELFDEDDAKEAIDNVLRWVVETIRKVFSKIITHTWGNSFDKSKTSEVSLIVI